MSALANLAKKIEDKKKIEQCEYSTVGVVIENENKEILTGFNGSWLSDICFYQNKNGIKSKVIENGKFERPEIVEAILRLNSEQLDDKYYLRNNGFKDESINKEASKIIKDYLESLDNEQVKEICRICYKNSDDSRIEASRIKLQITDDDEKIDNLLECKKNHINNIIHFIKDTKGFNFKLDIIKGTVEDCELDPKQAMIRELSEEVKFKLKEFGKSHEIFLNNNAVYNILIKFNLDDLFEDFFEFQNYKGNVKIYKTTTEKLAKIGLYPITDELSEIYYNSELYRIKFRSLDEIINLNPNNVVRKILEKYSNKKSMRRDERRSFAKMNPDQRNRRGEGRWKRSQGQSFAKMNSEQISRRGEGRWKRSQGQSFSKMGSNQESRRRGEGQAFAKMGSNEGRWNKGELQRRGDRKVNSKDYHKQKYIKYKLKYLNLKKKIENIR